MIPAGLGRPDYGRACLSSLVPAIFGEIEADWLPPTVRRAARVVLLLVDGLGAEQLVERRDVVPGLAGSLATTLTSVAPTTTAVALTSLTTGRPPAAHGVVGYRMALPAGDVLNVLSWRIGSSDGRASVDPAAIQPLPVFAGRSVPVVTKGEFRGTPFTDAHLRGARLIDWWSPAAIAYEVGRAVRAGEPFVYAYYDALDRVAHRSGLGAHYERELRAVERLVDDVQAELPPDAVVVVTADHGQVEVGSRVFDLGLADDPAIDAAVRGLSGEGRFRWLHVAPGEREAVRDALADRLGPDAWVATVDELEAAGVFGGPLTPTARGRLGDVAVLARAPVAWRDPSDPGEDRLVARHGSLTPAELTVPLCVVPGGGR